jgi:hypothetical protein
MLVPVLDPGQLHAAIDAVRSGVCRLGLEGVAMNRVPKALTLAGAGVGVWLFARNRRNTKTQESQLRQQDDLVDEMSDQSFPASDPPARW